MSKRAIMFCFCAVACLMLFSTACTPPPNDLMAAAENTVNQMDENQIDMYARAEYDLVTAEVDVDKKLPEFMERWSEISSSIEGGRGRAAQALAVEAKAFADSLTANLQELSGSEMWYELNAALDAASATADEFAEKAGG